MIRREAESFFAALGYFSRLPVPGWVGHSDETLGAAVRYLPAVGLVVGGLGAGVYWAAAQLWPHPVAVLLAMAALLYATGAFHEDGLADAADGLGGGWDKARILAIMKDSRVGSYGVVALWLGLTGRFALLAALPPAQLPAALVAAGALSRLCALLPLATMVYARADDDPSKARPLSARPGARALLLAASFALAGLALLPVPQALAGCLLAALATLWLSAKFQRWLGGYTGDCLGALQQVAEIGFYLGLLAQWR